MNHVTDWLLWQGIATTLLADGLVTAGWLVWKYRQEIAQRLRPPRTVRVTVTDKLGLTDSASVQTLTGGGTLTVGKSLQSSWNVRAPVSSSLTTGWNVEAPTPSLARRLEELASWYLHVS
jgi:hypothetical protein